MLDKLNDALAAYDIATGEVAAPPAWFIETMRSQGTRNITVETWNALCMNVRHLASDGAAVDALLKAFADLMSDAIQDIKSNTEAVSENAQAIADETTAREDADNAIDTKFEQMISQLSEVVDTKAIGKVSFNSVTGFLHFSAIDGTRIYSTQLPVGKILKNVTLSDDSNSFVFTFADDSTIVVSITDLTNPVWVRNVKDGGSVPPTTDAVKSYIDTNNTSLNKKVTDVQDDIALLKTASEGTLYKTRHIHLEDDYSASHIFGNALTHGVWNIHPSWSYSLYLAFDCLNAVDRKGKKVGITRNSLTFPSTENYYVYIPVNIPSGTNCKLLCDSYGAEVDEIYKYNFLDETGAQIFTYNVIVGVSSKIPDGKTAKTLVLIKRDPGVHPSSDVLVKNLRLYVDNSFAYRYKYDEHLMSDGYPESFTIYPSAQLNVSAEGHDLTADFSYIEKLPEEGV